MRFGVQLRGAGHDRRSWLVLFVLLLVVLAPTACVLWFMNEAMNSQRDVARRKLTEAYRAQLPLVAARLDAVEERRAAALEAAAAAQPDAPAVFEECVRTGLADSVLVLNADGALAYPSAAASPAVDPLNRREDWAAARGLEARSMVDAIAAYTRIAAAERDPSVAGRALQAVVRCLVQSGDKSRALGVIAHQFSSGPLLKAIDLQGRSIAADELLLALHLAPANEAAAQRLHGLLTTYRGSVVPATQRLFLVEELRGLPVKTEYQRFPLYEAEVLAARYREAERVRTGDGALRLSNLPGIWKLTSSGGRVIALYRTATVEAQLRSELSGTAELQFDITPPGAVASRHDEWTPAGWRLPGWQITLAVRDSKIFDEASRKQSAAYAWVAFLFIAAMAVLAVIGGQALKSQMRVARLKTDLMATVSHELKTPLASMKLLVELLLDSAEDDPKKTREYLEMVSRENDRLSRLIDNFLTFSRMERGYQRFDPVETTASAIVTAAVASLGERFHSDDCVLEVDVAGSIPGFRADEDSVVTVLRNLLDNAYKYGGNQKRIRLRAWRKDDSVCFAVEDNGIGIPAREQKKIFRRFYQVDRRLSRRTGGAGLGLSIVEFIVRAHGGSIQVTSRPGGGSTFTVSLPCQAEEVLT